MAAARKPGRLALELRRREAERSKFKEMADFVATTPESDALSKALRKAGFNFVGSTTMYAFMQAVGMAEDHTVGCFRKKEIS